MSRFTKNLRLIKLTEILSTNKHYITADSLAEQFGVTDRTIYRDLSDLDQLGYSIYNDRGYKIHKTTPAPAWSLSSEDIQTIKLFIKSSPLSNYEEYKNKIHTIFLKLRSIAQSQNESDSIPIQSAESYLSTNCKVKMNALEKSLSEQLVCEVLYQSMEESSPNWRTLYPHAMVIREGKWYLIAKDKKSKEIRLYRLERFHEYRLTEKTFKRDSSFSVEDYFKDSWSVFRGEKQTIKLRLNGKAIRVFQEREWIKPKVWEKLDDNQVECTITVQGCEEITAWALSMAPYVEVIEPKELREQIKITLTETLKKYI